MKSLFSARISLFLIICVIGLFSTTQTYAQIDSLIYHEDYRLRPEDKGNLTFSFDNINFVRDNEYQGKRVKGYTLPGFWIQPKLGFQLLKNLKVEAGVHLLRYWGTSKYPNLNYSDIAEWKGEQYQKGFHALPFFRVQVALSKTFNIVIGDLYGKTNHNLIDPLYNKEMALTADPEAGLQLLWDTKPMHFDMWVNWESFIFQNDNHQESFTFGLSTRFKANKPTSKAHVYFPVQMIFQHRGGEINPNAESRKIKTWLNAAAGAGLDLNFQDQLFRKLNLEVTGAYFGQQAGAMLPFEKGYGIYAKATADIYRFRVQTGYWQGNDFITVFGNPLFGDISISEKGLIYDKTKMLFASLEYAQKLGKGFALGVHADVYNNFSGNAYTPETGWYKEPNSLSFAAGIYLRINPSFLIKKF